MKPINDNASRLVNVTTLGAIGTTSSSYVGSNTSYKWHSGGRFCGGPGGSNTQWVGTIAPQANGIFWRDSNLRESLITDGLSSTIMVGERRWGAPAGGAAAQAALALANLANNEQLSVERSLASAVEAVNALTAGPARRSYSSTHAGAIMFLFCDGAVRPIADTIGHTVDRSWSSTVTSVPWSTFELLIGRNDGQLTAYEF